jgi:hypothetical protein
LDNIHNCYVDGSISYFVGIDENCKDIHDGRDLKCNKSISIYNLKSNIYNIDEAKFLINIIVHKNINFHNRYFVIDTIFEGGNCINDNYNKMNIDYNLKIQ